VQQVSLPAGRGVVWTERRPTAIRPATAVVVALLALVAGNLGRIPVLNLGERTAPLLISDVALGVALLVGALAMLRARTMQLDGVALTALAFAAIGGLSAVAAVPRFGLSGGELVGSLAYLARWIAYFAVYVVVINCVRRGDTERIWSAAESALLVIAAFGIVQAAFLPDFALMVYGGARRVLDWDPQGHRLVSTVLDPNLAAAMLVIGILVQVARLSAGVRMPWWKPALLFTALVLTLSRSGALALVVGLGAIIVVSGIGKRVVRAGLVVLALGAIALPKLIAMAGLYDKLSFANASALARLVTWLRSLELFLENPWFGVGFNTYGFVQAHRGYERLGTAAYSAEGGLLFVGVMTGIVGLLCYLLMLWHVWRNCRSGWRDPESSASERGLHIGAVAATIAILAHSVFVNSLLMPFVMELLWVLWGLVFVARGAGRRTTAVRP
jgi:hypothetical protein